MSDDGDLRFFGLYRGVVHSAADPSKKGRLQIKVPQVNGQEELDWALPCFPFLTQKPVLDATAGPYAVAGRTKKITLRLPKRGDAVWVMFEAGNPGAPVWLGTWIGM